MKDDTQGNPKAYLYIRVATVEQLEDAASRQETILRNYAEQAGYSVVGKTIAPGSATENIEELKRLAIDREYRGDASVILAAEPSRLARDIHELFGVTKAFSLANIHVAFADGTGDLSERLMLLPAFHIQKPEIDDSFLLEESDELFIQTM